MTADSAPDARPGLPIPNRHRTIRIVTVTNSEATADDLVLDHASATDRFGPDVAALIFKDQQPGADDVTCTAALRYGAPAAALIFPHAASDEGPAVNNESDQDTAPALPLVDRVVS